MLTRHVTVRCKNGLHMRIAAQVVKRTHDHDASVFLQCAGCPRVDASSILQLMTTGAAVGARIGITAQGPDEEAVVESLTELFEGGAGI